ncbi:unnamed protein product [Symbiodinium natans]|uniref:Uncharacterized protein n=1 Tax=Symbiodinium natans TaxID=878477 RepID=A0A812IGS6_9DINO|nr:unnamed protein product [Symbiodinium natans]
MDDDNLKSVLKLWSDRDHTSPLEAFLKAPPQAELEAVLGFSLNPEHYTSRPADRSDSKGGEAHVVEQDTLTESQIAAALSDEGKEPDPAALPPQEACEPEPAPLLALPVEAEQSPKPKPSPFTTPVKPKEPVIVISPGSPMDFQLHVEIPKLESCFAYICSMHASVRVLCVLKATTPVPVDSPLSGLSSQFASMDPNVLESLLALVKEKLLVYFSLVQARVFVCDVSHNLRAYKSELRSQPDQDTKKNAFEPRRRISFGSDASTASGSISSKATSGRMRGGIFPL